MIEAELTHLDGLEAMLRKYLLGSLPEAERLALDERLLTDDELAQLMRLVESELIDDYTAGRLDHTQRDLFTSKFLVTEERKQALSFSTELGRYASAQSVRTPAKTEAPSRWLATAARLFSFESPRGWAVAGSFALVLLAVGLIWFVAIRRSEQPPSIVKKTSPAVSPPQPTGSPITVAQAPQPPVETKPTPEPAPPIAVANIVILPGTLRSGGETARVAVPRGDRDLVRISLVLENPEPATYRAELETADGQKVAVKEKLQVHKNGQSKVTFDVPARLLQNGDYQLRLSRVVDGETHSAGRYYFRALQQ